jgi:cytochrome c oxidase assembly protein subunit 19
MPIGSSLSSLPSPVPPERGAFPLDLEGKCKDLVVEYLKCLKSNKNCRHISKEYLKCRMDNGLMVKDDFKNLGFK